MARPQGLLYFMKLGNMNFRQRWKEGTDYLKWKWVYAKRIKQFKDIHKGEDCFIIGNGPSLNKMDLSKLNGYHTFGLNKIFMIFEKVKFDLSYLVAVNDLVVEQCKPVYEDFEVPIFLSHPAASKANIADKNHIHRLYDLNTWSFYEDISEPIHAGWTVTYVAMQIAYYMGFKRVFLIGVDHSFKQSIGKENVVEVMEGDDENHFHPDYFKGMKWNLADVYGSEVSYHLANYHYIRNDRQIFNATVGGKLDVFPRVSFERALQEAKRK